MGTKVNTICRCPDCGDKFKVPSGEPLPKFCPMCGSYVGIDPDFVPTRMNMVSPLTQSHDYTYRKLEADSEARAEAARPMIERHLVEAGIPVEQAQRQAAQQANDIKVTNMRDNIREGEVAAMGGPQPSPAYVQQVAMVGGDPRGSFQGGMAVAGAGPAPFNESGAKSIFAIQSATGGARAPAPATVQGMQGGFGKVGT